jgi:hypothetical protein
VKIARLAALIAVLFVVLVPGPARADARDVANRVVEQWKAAGATATLLQPRFVFDDETVLISIPQDETIGAGCIHVALVGARGLSFHARLSDVTFDPVAPPETGARASSLAGVLELARCDVARPVRHVIVTADAGRGAIEIVFAHGTASLPTLSSVIPERTGGALPPIPEAGTLPPLPTPEKRAEAAEARAKREGARILARQSFTSSEDGTGDADLDLDAGCHRIEVFANDPRTERPGRRFRLDVDAELRDPSEDRVIARDRTEAPDARLETCVGQTTRVSLAYAGTPPGGAVTVTQGTWPLPARIPPMWGPTTRSKMARVMFTRHIAVPSEDPIFLAQGGSGTTPFPLPVETGGCYVAVVGLTHGHAKSLQLRAIVGARESTDERGATEEAALTAFCVRAFETARIEVHTRGPAVGYGLAVFRVKSGVWEAGR